MSLMFVILLAIQAPAVAQPPVVVTGNAVSAKPEKPKLVCRMMEVTGSHARHRICQDADGNYDPMTGPGVGQFKPVNADGVSGLKPARSIPSG
jgi:hypothetical protein